MENLFSGQFTYLSMDIESILKWVNGVDSAANRPYSSVEVTQALDALILKDRVAKLMTGEYIAIEPKA